MKALTIRQPWASLIALGVKRIETRSWRAPHALIGKTIAIHAGASPAAWNALDAPSLMSDRTAITAVLAALPGVVIDERSWCTSYISEGAIRFSGLDLELPLGAVVATATLADCVPMVDEWPRMGTGNVLFVPTADDLAYPCGSRAHVWLSGDPKGQDVSDQLPYGDFTPGRWAWVLEDVQPTEVRCPACWGAGERYAANGLRVVCICGDAGHCSPVPAKGRLGLWEWQP